MRVQLPPFPYFSGGQLRLTVAGEFGRDMRHGQAYTVGKTGAKRRVWVNGFYCVGLAAAAKKASALLGRRVTKQDLWYALEGRKKIEGLEVSDKKPPEKKIEPVVREKGELRQLINYPLGEEPWNRGLPRRWV